MFLVKLQRLHIDHKGIMFWTHFISLTYSSAESKTSTSNFPSGPSKLVTPTAEISTCCIQSQRQINFDSEKYNENFVVLRGIYGMYRYIGQIFCYRVLLDCLSVLVNLISNGFRSRASIFHIVFDSKILYKASQRLVLSFTNMKQWMNTKQEVKQKGAEHNRDRTDLSRATRVVTCC